MSVDRSELLTPPTTAVLTMELQRGIVGDLALMPELADELRAAGVIANAGAVCAAARATGARVVHCTAVTRPDGAGRANNCRLLAATAAGASAILEGSAGAELVPELGPEPVDIVVPRLHGVTPFTGTSLDQILRNLGVTTVVVVGASLNVGVVGLVLTAIDLGYQVVVVRDAVAGVPAEYGDAMVDNTIALLATVITVEELRASW